MSFQEQNEKLIENLISRNVLKTPRIIQTFKKIPRHLFVSEEYLSHAYADYPLPTMHGQTISQPYTVAIMIEALQPKKENNILEIGTGSGWTVCLLSHIVGKEGKVVTIDVYQDLIDFAKENIKKTKLKNIKVICGDGKLGYEKNAPYDCVLINAACDEIPKPVIDQTKIHGRIVAPVNSFFGQRMIVAEKISKNKLKKKDLGSFVFVPLR